MATITIPTFRGEIPRRTPRLLEDTQATIAINCNLERGHLEALAGPGQEANLPMSCRTIFRHEQDGWLGWEKPVNVVKSAVHDVDGDRPLGQLLITGDRDYPTQYLAGGHVCRLGLPRPETAPLVSLAREAKIATAKCFAFGSMRRVIAPPRYGYTHRLNEIGESRLARASRCMGIGFDDRDAIQAVNFMAAAWIEEPDDEMITNCGLERSSAYCYTYVRSLADGIIMQESAPSPASAIIDIPDGHGAKIEGFELPALPEHGITHIRLYRTVAGLQGSDFRFVTELAMPCAAFVDTRIDRDISSETLQTATWDPIPDDAAGLVVTSNGIYAAFRGNELLLSEMHHPYAFPADYRLSMEDRIVALGHWENTIIVLTEGRPYLVSGTEPGQMQVMRLPYEQSCVAALSLAYFDSGLLYASPDGLAQMAGNGQTLLATAELFTRGQWQKLRPETILGASIDGKYLAFFRGTNHGFILAREMQGVVRIELPSDMRVLALYHHSVDDCIYLSIDRPDEHGVYKWEAGELLPYTWRSKPFFTSRLVSMRAMRLEGEQEPRNRVAVTIYGPDLKRPRQKLKPDDTRTKRIQSMRAEKLWTLELQGRATVYELRLGTGVEELEYGA